MTIKQDLQAARALIDTPEKWAQGMAAQDAAGNEVPPTYSSAQRFCAWGAVVHIVSHGTVRYSDCLSALRKQIPEGYDLVPFNDAPTTTHQQVLEMFDRAIAAQEAS